jgi:NTE family protein
MKVKVGLALGGGGARGLAHLGVLKVFEDANIPIDYLVGSSMGAIIAAMYAHTPDAQAHIRTFTQFFETQDYESLGLKYIVPQTDQNSNFLHQFTQVLTKRIIINISQTRTGIIKSEKLENVIANLLPNIDIQETRIPLGIVVTDLNNGETKTLTSGNLRRAVTISASIPGYIPPVAEGEKLYTDGGVSAPVPVEETYARGANFVIGVSVAMRQINPLQKPNLLDIIARTDTIRGLYLSEKQLARADIALHPDLADAHWSEFMRCNHFIEKGIEEAIRKLPEIKKQLRRKKSIFARFF